LHSDIGPHTVPKDNDLLIFRIGMAIFFFEWRPVSFGGSRCIDTARLPRQDRGPVSGGNRSAASCICTVLRRALCHYSKRSPLGLVWRENKTQAGTKHHKQNRHTRDVRGSNTALRGNQGGVLTMMSKCILPWLPCGSCSRCHITVFIDACQHAASCAAFPPRMAAFTQLTCQVSTEEQST
jgi:hypothetical protein